MSPLRADGIEPPAGAGPGAGYPPAPWHLQGHAHGHLYAVAARDLPPLPDGFRPAVIGGRGLVVAGWVSYEAAGVLRYRELFAAVAGLARGRPTATVTHMWVDSPASRDGGRELWGYPKELAELDLSIRPDGSAAARLGDRELARGAFRSRLTLPRMRARSGTVQELGGRLQPVAAVIRGRPALGTGTFAAAPDGPLAFLRSGRRLLSFGLGDFDATFGVDPGPRDG